MRRPVNGPFCVLFSFHIDLFSFRMNPSRFAITNNQPVVMKKLFIPLFIFIVSDLLAQTTASISDYEKFINREGSLILSKIHPVFEFGGLESLDILLMEAHDETRDETIRALAFTINKSSAYLSRSEIETLIAQMKKIQLLLVETEVTKEHVVSYNLRNSLFIEVNFNTSKKVWKYTFGVADGDRQKTKELSSTEFQDVKAIIEGQVTLL